VALAPPAVVRAEDARVEATVDARSVAVGDYFTLTITVYGDSKISQPDVSNLDGFQVLGSYTSQNISMVNARVTRSVSLQYQLLALREGEFTLGPFTVKSGSKAYETEPITVRVTGGAPGLGQPGQPGQRGQPSQQGQGGAPSASSSKDLILAFASADKKTAYVGEQITYTLTFAYRTDVDDVTYLEPDHTGFWFEDIGETGPEIKVINGIKYYAITKITAFFPISSGRFAIGEGGVRYLARDSGGSSRDPFGFFGRDPFDALRRREGVVKADGIGIDVLPLPAEGRPADFSGAVGNFTMAVVPSSRQARVGESVTLSVRVEGQGNVKSIGDIPLPKMDGFRVFAPKSRDSLRVDRTRVGGAKIFDLVLVPERVGRFTLDGFSLSYFDPAKRAYVTTSAPAVDLAVEEGDEATMRALAAGGGERSLRKQDIRYIKAKSDVADDLALATGGAAGLVRDLAPAALVVAGIVVAASRRRASRSGKAAVRKALRALQRDLQGAEVLAASQDYVGASSAASRAVRAYLASRLRVTESAVDAGLIAGIAGIAETTRSRLNGLLRDLDCVRFAPVASGAGEIERLLAEAGALARQVDQEWSG
jgi:hypothetical protein